MGFYKHNRKEYNKNIHNKDKDMEMKGIQSVLWKRLNTATSQHGNASKKEETPPKPVL